jgi:hypothetical protein
LKVKRWYTSADFTEAKALVEKGCPVTNEEINLRKMGLKLYRGLVMPIACYPFKEDQNRLRTLSPSAPSLNCQILSASPALIFSTPPTEEEQLSGLETLTPSEPLPLEGRSPKIPDTPDVTPDNDTGVVDTDDEATSGDNKHSEMAGTPTPVRTMASLERKRVE